jgi:DNA replication factor GINS
VAFRGIIYSYPIRVVFKKDVDIPLLGISHKAGTEVDIPLYLALKLEEMGAVEIDDRNLIQPKEVASLKYVEQRESYPARLPEGFYPRVKLTVHILNKRGDVKAVRDVLQYVKELVVERIRKIAVLVATRPDIINDPNFLERLTPEEKALLHSMYVSLSSFVLSVT